MFIATFVDWGVFCYHGNGFADCSFLNFTNKVSKHCYSFYPCIILKPVSNKFELFRSMMSLWWHKVMMSYWFHNILKNISRGFSDTNWNTGVSRRFFFYYTTNANSPFTKSNVNSLKNNFSELAL